MRTLFPVSLLMLAAVPVLSGCATQALEHFTQEHTIYNDRNEPPSVLTTITLQGLMSPEILPQAWSVSDRVLKRLNTAYLAMDETPVSPLPFRVAVIDAGMVNAFALPNGRIYVTSSLLETVASEDELAGVIAHEMAHSVYAHYEGRVDRMTVPWLGLPLAFTALSQPQELEADRFAVALVREAGYSPLGLIQFFRRLEARRSRLGIGSGGGVFSTHPALAKRIAGIAGKDLPPLSADTADFDRMKRELRDRVSAYEQELHGDVHPARFESGDRRFDRTLKRVAERLKARFDLDTVETDLANLRLWADTARETAVVATWSARLAMVRGDDEAALERLNEAVEADPTLESPRWLRIGAYIDLDREEKARDAWRSETRRCKTAPECLLWSALFAGAGGLDRDEAADLAREYRNAILRRAEEGPLAAWMEAGLSRTLIMEIRADLYRKPSERTSEYGIPEGFTPSRKLKDYRLLSQRMLARGEHFSYSEQGLALGVSGGYGGFAGSLKAVLDEGPVLSFNVGWRNWPGEFGLIFSPLLGRDVSLQGVETRVDSVSGGLYYRRDLTKWRFRPWLQAAVLREGVYLDDNPDVDRDAITAGWTAGLRLGWSFRFRSSSQTSGMLPHFRFSAGVRRSWFRPFRGSDGIANGWDVRGGCTFFLGEIQSEFGLEREPPPAFF